MQKTLLWLGLLGTLMFAATPTILAQCSEPCLGDLDGDCDVDLCDLAILLSNYGKVCTPPIAHYTFDGDANDSSGYENHGTVHEAVFSDDVPPQLGDGQSICFDADDDDGDDVVDHVQLEWPLQVNGKDYTISFWIKTTASLGYIIHSYGPSGWAQESLTANLGWDSIGGYLLLYQSGRGLLLIPGPDVEDGDWHHVAFTRDVESMVVNAYLDGQHVGTGTFDRPETEPETTWFGASVNHYSNDYVGCLDELRVYDRILTNAEIEALAEPYSEWEYNPDTGHYYTLTNEPAYWTGAEEQAEDAGGRLVTINDAEEQAWLEQTWPHFDNRNLWIGLHQVDGIWQWVSGEDSEYRNWATGEPSGDGSVAEMNHQDSEPGAWNDEHYQEQLGIIERIP